MARLEGLLAQKAIERSRVLGLYRRGRLTDPNLDAQMDEIAKEQEAVEAQAAELRGADSIGANISSAQALLANLRKRLDESVSWEQKRRLVEDASPRLQRRSFTGARWGRLQSRDIRPTKSLPLG